MKKRLQVFLDDEEFREIKRVARRHRMTASEWVRRSLRCACSEEPSEEPGRRRHREGERDGHLDVDLREGTNGFTCIPVPGEPMCLDEPWMKFFDAYVDQKDELTIDRVGIAYMFQGDPGASNIDPYAKGPTPDNEWVQTGPHLMLIAPDPALLEHNPTDPKSGGPYVMWRGTHLAHVTVPVDEEGVEMPHRQACSAALSRFPVLWERPSTATPRSGAGCDRRAAPPARARSGAIDPGGATRVELSLSRRGGGAKGS